MSSTPITREQRRTYVKRGAAWLTEIAPGWLDIVDLGILDINSIFNCVAGQVFRINPGYTAGYTYLRGLYFPEQDEAAEHGFSEFDAETWESEMPHQELQELWTEEIKELRAAA